MRCLARDKRWVLAAFFVEKRACEDEQGRLTGKHEVVRTEPMPFLVSVSASKGTAENSLFGIDLDYDKTIIIEDVELPIDESTVFWVDNVEQELFLGAANSSEDEAFTWMGALDVSHDYVVKRVAKTPNCLAVAVKRIENGS